MILLVSCQSLKRSLWHSMAFPNAPATGGKSLFAEYRHSQSSHSFSDSDDENEPSTFRPKNSMRKSRSMYPLRKISNTNVKRSQLSLRSLSGQTPPLDSSDDDIPQTHFRESAARVSSVGLPTPPTSDDERTAVEVSPTNQRQISDDRTAAMRTRGTQTRTARLEYPFPVQPVSLPSARENTLPQTPGRRCFSARTRKAPKSTWPDRFISNRSTPATPQSPAETFRVSKETHQLTPEEKLIRNRTATPDPFGPLRVSRIRADRLNNSRSPNNNAIRRSHSRTIGFATVSEVATDTATRQTRQSSPGNIWNVGGPAQVNGLVPTRGVSNGRGGYISSGSNAPMYESRFLDDLSTDQDVDQMEQRLAAALDIDRTSRILGNTKAIDDSRSVSTGSIGLKRKPLYLEHRTTWQEEGWANKGIVLDTSFKFPQSCHPRTSD